MVMSNQKPSERIAELLHETIEVLQRIETAPASPVETFIVNHNDVTFEAFGPNGRLWKREGPPHSP